jgi:transcriptional regulator with XRE-family HTH domain
MSGSKIRFVARLMKAKRIVRGKLAIWVARKMGISSAYLSMLESGKRTFSPKMKALFLKAIGETQ